MSDPQKIIVAIEDFRLKSEANTSSHWFKKSRRVKSNREIAQLYTLAEINRRSNAGKPDLTLPVAIRLIRIAPRKLDAKDNLPMAFKAVRDGVADALLPHDAGNQHRTWADDDGDQIEWEYDQRKGNPKQHAVLIEITEVVT